MAGDLKNLLVRVGADASGLKKELDKANKDLNKFGESTKKSLQDISGKKGLGGLGDALRKHESGKGFEKFTNQMRTFSEKTAKTTTKSLGELSESVAILSTASEGLGAALGPVGLALGATVAITAAAVVGIGAAAQEAVKFESDLGRLNRKLGESTSGYMKWAQSMGLAKSTAAELGSSYSLLLSSFIHDNKTLTDNTEKLVQATRVIADGTGRSIDDVMTRIKSGLLGNTEAINDLDIFVNVKMIESTKAFSKFANGKHWDQLAYNVQQQILLEAILEQAYDRFGSTLQNNVNTQQQNLIEKLKDVKLNLSLAFLPIWEKVLPALNALADKLVYVSELAARFSFGLFGKNYDEATKGMQQQTNATEDQSKAVNNLGDSYQKAGKAAEHALASFDEINQLGNFGDGSGGPGGSGGSGSGGSGKGKNNTPTVKPIDWSKILNFPPLPKLQLKFDPPTPPDAGLGAVATAVVASMNTLLANSKATLDQLKQAWADTLTYITGQINSYQPTVSAGWISIQNSIAATNPQLDTVKVNWHTVLDYMQAQLNAYVPYLVNGWQLIRQSIDSFQTALNGLHDSWHTTLDYMQSQLNSYQPYLSYGWTLISDSIKSLTDPLGSLKTSWHETLDVMQKDVNSYQPYVSYGISLIKSSLSDLLDELNKVAKSFPLGMETIFQSVKAATQPITDLIKTIESAFSGLMGMLSQPIQMPQIQMPNVSSIFGDMQNLQGDASARYNLPVVGPLLKMLDQVAGATKPLSDIGQQVLVPGAGAAGAAGGVEAAGASIIAKIQAWLQSLGGLGSSVPAFANGGITSGPMLAMVGDNVGGQEVISPLDDLMDMVSSAVGNAMMMANKMNNTASGNREIVLQLDGSTLARVMVPYNIKENTRIGNMQVVPG